MELANALQVHPSTISYWVDTNKINGTKDATGRIHFTEEQVMKCLIKKHVGSISKEKSVLYIVDGADEDVFTSMVKSVYDIQKQLAPKSVHIEDIQTFLSSSENNSSEVTENDLKKYEQAIKARIIKEISKQVEKYVYNKVHYIGELDERYSSFTIGELKSLILGDADKELIKRFDNVLSEIKENPTEKETNVDGSLNAKHTINYAFLKITLENRLTEIAKSVGIADSRFLISSARQLLGYDTLVDKDTCDLLSSKSLKLNENNEFVKKALKAASVQQKNNNVMAKVRTLIEQGYYYTVKYNKDDINSHQYIYNLLDDNTFKKVVYMGSSPLVDQLKFKLNSQIQKGQIEFIKSEPSNLNKKGEN